MLYKCAEIHYTASVFGDKAENTGGVVSGKQKKTTNGIWDLKVKYRDLSL